MKEKRKVIPPKLDLPLKRQRPSKSLTTVVSFRVSDEELLFLRWLEAKTRRSASDIMREAFGCILQRTCAAE